MDKEKGMQPENDLITVQTHKEITHLYKKFLEILEDIRHQQQIMLQKVSDHTSSEFSNQINYFTQSYYEQLRKRILDSGNDCERQLLAFLDFFNFQIDSQKIKEEANSRRIVKKFITTSPIELQ